MNKLAKLLFAFATIGSVSAANAGGMAEPTIEPEVVAAASSSSKGGLGVLIAVLVIGAVVASSNSNNGE